MKDPTFRGGIHKKQYRAGDCLKRGLGQFVSLRGALARTRGWCYWGGWGLIPQCALWEWCKIWRETYFLYQKWQEFGEFWSEHQKVWNICTFIGPFCAKYTTFDLKTYKGVYFMKKTSCKIWRKIDLWFGKRYEEFSKFSSEHLKMSRLVSWDPFIEIRKCMSYKLHELQRS